MTWKAILEEAKKNKIIEAPRGMIYSNHEIKGEKEFYGFYEIIDNILPESAILAGGAASSFLTRGGYHLNDFDIFFVCEPEKVHSEIAICCEKLKILCTDYAFKRENIDLVEVKAMNHNFQFIKKSFTSIADIILKFDLSACKVAYKKKFYYTIDYLYAIQTGTMFFDCERLTWSSAFRLNKYKNYFILQTDLSDGFYSVKNRRECYHIKDKKVIKIGVSGYDKGYCYFNNQKNVLHALNNEYDKFNILPDYKIEKVDDTMRFALCKHFKTFDEHPEISFASEIEKAYEAAEKKIRSITNSPLSKFGVYISKEDYFESA